MIDAPGPKRAHRDAVSTTARNSPTLYLVRHGRTKLNAEGCLRGHVDVPLDATGRVEAARLGRLFAPVPLGAIFSSPLVRAVETAHAIAANNDRAELEVVVDDRLVDRDYGAWAGHRMAEVESRFGSIDAAPGVEKTVDVIARTRSFLDDIRPKTSMQLVVAVAHDAVNRLLLTTLCNLGDEAADIVQPTGCWNAITCTHGRWTAQVEGAVPGDGRLP